MQPLSLAVQENLWVNSCVSECDLWDVCGGSPSAPCGCIWQQPERRYKCDRCHVLCLERKSQGFSVSKQLAEGLGLEEIGLDHKEALTFPAFIPLGTHEASTLVRASVVGVDIKTLFNKARKRPVSPMAFLKTRGTLTNFLKIGPTTRIIAVMNGQDWLLEGFWGMGEERRRAFFTMLQSSGFSLVTAPTFSITHEEGGYPASHNVLMQRRHHKVLNEIQEAGLISVPNLYWRNQYDVECWTTWMQAQKNLRFVSRDFSLTKSASAFTPQLEGLTKALEPLKKKPHVLLIGVGKAKWFGGLKTTDGGRLHRLGHFILPSSVSHFVRCSFAS